MYTTVVLLRACLVLFVDLMIHPHPEYVALPAGPIANIYVIHMHFVHSHAFVMILYMLCMMHHRLPMDIFEHNMSIKFIVELINGKIAYKRHTNVHSIVCLTYTTLCYRCLNWKNERGIIYVRELSNSLVF